MLLVTMSAPPSIRLTSVGISSGSSVKSAWSVTTTSRFGYVERRTASRSSISSEAAYPRRRGLRKIVSGRIRVYGSSTSCVSSVEASSATRIW